MKKTLISIATLTLLAGCTSAEEKLQGDINDLQEQVNVTQNQLNDYVLERNTQAERLGDVSKEVAALNAFVNPEAVFENSGIIVSEENGNLVLTFPENVTFAFNSSELTNEITYYLDVIADALAMYPNVQTVVEGHTDNVGSDAYNKKLSLKRAEAAKEYFVNKGTDATRIETVGMSFSEPVADNGTAEGRAQNRRLVINFETHGLFTK